MDSSDEDTYEESNAEDDEEEIDEIFEDDEIEVNFFHMPPICSLFQSKISKFFGWFQSDIVPKNRYYIVISD